MSQIGILFPGQGSQAPGMGQFLYDNFSIAKECYEEASDAISLDMKKLCFEGSVEDLALTENTQPALLTTSTAMLRALKGSVSVDVNAYAGHSIGEYAAVVASGGMGFSDAVKAVRLRGQAMQEAVPVGQGGMLAIVGPQSNEIEEVCTWAKSTSGIDGVLSPANFNAPDQTVVSGNKALTDWLAENIKDYKFASEPRRVRAIALNVSAPFHCEMMMPAQEKMKSCLEGMIFNLANQDVIQNFTAKEEKEASALRENLIQQVSGAVRWVECLKRFESRSINHFIECGHGKVLAGLNKKINSNFETLNIANLEEFKKAEVFLSSQLN